MRFATARLGLPVGSARLLLRRLRSLPDREIASRRSLPRTCLGGSLGGPSRSHRSRELLTTFRREIEFSLLFLGDGCFFLRLPVLLEILLLSWACCCGRRQREPSSSSSPLRCLLSLRPQVSLSVWQVSSALPAAESRDDESSF